ncbi:MAG: DUF4349 domain-containing protein, partial [Gemmatimonadaceae bacterium]
MHERRLANVSLYAGVNLITGTVLMNAGKLVSLTTAFVILVPAACGTSGKDMSAPDRASIEMPPRGKPAPRDEALSRVVNEGAGVADAVQRAREPRDSVAPSMIIRNGNATVEVEKLDPAIAALRRLAQQMGGYVANTTVTTGRDQTPSGTIELKIPVQRFDTALVGLEPLGKVESVNTTAEDVGEEFVDVSARLANARRLEERIVVILATRTGKLEDVIAAERELARIREEIERYEGRLRYLRTRVALSTLVVTVHESYPVVGGPGAGPIAESFKQMWR